MATTESLQRWRIALQDIEQIGAMSSARQFRSQFDIPQMATGTALNTMSSRFLPQVSTLPFRDLWSTELPAIRAHTQFCSQSTRRLPRFSKTVTWDP